MTTAPQTPLPSRLRSDAGRTPTGRSTPVQERTTRNLAPTAGQGPDLEDAIPAVTLDPHHARYCTCDHNHLDIGGFDRRCPRHDPEAGLV